MDKVELFISYAPEDDKLRQELYTYLTTLQRNKPISFWSPHDIIPGKETAVQIRDHLRSAHIILLLISASYLASNEIYQQQVLPAMERSKTEGVLVIPIPLRPIDWEDEPFGNLPALPANKVSIIQSTNRDEAWREVIKGIRQIVDLLTSPSPTPAGATAGQSTTTTVTAAAKEGVPAMATSPSPTFDVFLCYNSQDREAVKAIGNQLKARGVKPWLDEWELRPGLPWIPALEEQIENSKSVAVFVGKGRAEASGKIAVLAPWQRMEVSAALQEAVNRGYPVIPVVLKDAPEKPQLPLFLRGMHWIDFRKSDPDPLNQLIWGITGIPDTWNTAHAAPPTPAAQAGLTPWERKVRQERLEMLDDERQVIAERVKRVRATWRYETNEALKMQQEHQIQQDEAHLKKLDDEISQLRRELGI